ncbi:MAG: VWA domain-containing protein [Thermoguttaceae bacterium]
MTFLQPMMLWSLLALLPLAALYFLKVRPSRKPTTAMFLWEQVLDQRRSNSLFRRLRDFWSLLILALACAAIGLALARPEWTDRRQDLLIVLDQSASMAARQGGHSRIELARRAAAELIEGLDGVQRAAVAVLDDRLVYRSHLTDNPRELLDAVEAVAATQRPLRLDAMPRREDFREIQTDRRRSLRIVLISDGCFGDQKLSEHIELIRIGDSLENMGLVAADMAYLPAGGRRLAVYCQVASSFAKPREVDLAIARLEDDGREQPAKVVPLTVRPGVNPPETFWIEQAEPGRWVARLGAEDVLTSDDAAYLIAAQPSPIRVQVRSSDRFFLEKSVLAFSQAEGLLTLVHEKPDVTLASGESPEANRLLLFHPTGQSPWWKDLGETIEAPAPRVVAPNHPALRHVDAATIPFVGARRLTPPPGAQILVADDHGLPLVYLARHEGRTAVVVNLDPVAADFYFSAWFPVLVHSAATHLAGREQPLPAACRPGQSITIPGASDDTVSTWTDDGGKPRTVFGRQLTLDDRLGYSELKNIVGRWWLGNSLLASSETLLDHPATAVLGEPLSRGRSPTWWLTLFAVLALTVESVLYHRRKVG